jgi:hypothetical protein
VARSGASGMPSGERDITAGVSTSASSREPRVTGKHVWAVFVLVVLIGALFDFGVRIGAADTVSSETFLDRTSYFRECRYFTFRRGPSARRIPAERNGPLPDCPLLPP